MRLIMIDIETIHMVSFIAFVIPLCLSIIIIFNFFNLFDSDLSSPSYDNVFGDVIRALLKLANVYGWINSIFCVISFATTYYTHGNRG